MDADVVIPATYTVRPAETPAARPVQAPPPSHLLSAGLIELPCFHPLGPNGTPDLLGEIFEWLSGDHERSITERDPVGRIPFSETVHGLYGISPRVPWATEAVRWLNTMIGVAAGRTGSAAAVLDGPLGRTVLAATHDLDFLPGNAVQTGVRYAKNVVHALSSGNPDLMAQVIAAGTGWFRGQHPLAQLAGLVAREQELGISSSVNILCLKAHKRDANYLLGETRTMRALEQLAAAGVEIGLHGSWTSLEERGQLAVEYRRLAESGYVPLGGRQHWLRFDGPALFDELVAAGAWYDSTLGYADVVGFRHGLSFPFPPWNFASEETYPLLEIPLAVMDGAVAQSSGAHAREAIMRATERSWGGSAILWHDPVFGGTQLLREVGDLYWDLKRPETDWTRPIDVVRGCWPAYEAWDLLPSPPSPLPAPEASHAPAVTPG